MINEKVPPPSSDRKLISKRIWINFQLETNFITVDRIESSSGMMEVFVVCCVWEEASKEDQDTSNRTQNPIGFNFNLHLSSFTMMLLPWCEQGSRKEGVDWEGLPQYFNGILTLVSWKWKDLEKTEKNFWCQLSKRWLRF